MGKMTGSFYVDQFGIMGHPCVEQNRLLARRSASVPNPTPIFVFNPQASLRKVKNCQLCRRKHDLSILETELRTLARLKDPISQAVFVTVVERTKRRNINTLLLRASCHGRKSGGFVSTLSMSSTSAEAQEGDSHERT